MKKWSQFLAESQEEVLQEFNKKDLEAVMKDGESNLKLMLNKKTITATTMVMIIMKLAKKQETKRQENILTTMPKNTLEAKFAKMDTLKTTGMRLLLMVKRFLNGLPKIEDLVPTKITLSELQSMLGLAILILQISSSKS
jgi:hypothetical protein